MRTTTPFYDFQIKLWMQETGHEIYYVGWVWEGNSEKSGDIAQPWLTWRPKVLAFRGSNLYYMEYPPVFTLWFHEIYVLDKEMAGHLPKKLPALVRIWWLYFTTTNTFFICNFTRASVRTGKAVKFILW